MPAPKDYRHRAKRKNNPPAKLADQGTVPAVPKITYAYNPHLPPVLRFDASGGSDELPELLDKATREPLTAEEARVLAEALQNRQPWLEWTGKRELPAFAVDPVALHIHERVSTQAVLAAAARLDVEKSLFADPQQDYRDAVQFYKHDVDWSNRLILGDSLQVMASLARREDLAGKVQMIYLDPPYGIKFASNFQPEVGKRDVKDKETDLTREPEMVKAYRDTWHLGVHSYLSYLRDRLIVARELLAETGSIFLQISDENLHRVRLLLDEVFGLTNFVSIISFNKSSGLGANLLPTANDFILWYAREKSRLKYRQLFGEKGGDGQSSGRYNSIWLKDGSTRPATQAERDGNLPDGGSLFTYSDLTKPGPGSQYDIGFNGKTFRPEPRWWGFRPEGFERVSRAERIVETGKSISFVRLLDDFRAFPINNVWTEIGGIMSRSDPKVYVVQTSTAAIANCLLMTTDPGDLVLDPTCGSGTTAYVAEQWGRRWITIDTSRVAVAIARQRLLTAKYDYYRLRDEKAGVGGGFVYKSVPHVTLKSIAQNHHLDPIFAKHEPILDKKLAACNKALKEVTKELHEKLAAKLQAKPKKAITDADRRRWNLPAKKSEFQHWTVPFDADEDWPKGLIKAVNEYRAAWRAKMNEVNGCIAANAEQEELVDQPEVTRNVLRVSGPFTVEAVQPPEMMLGEEERFGGEPEILETGFSMREVRLFSESQNVTAYLDKMVKLLRQDGVRFPDNRQMKFTRLEPLFESGSASGFHAEGRWALASGPGNSPGNHDGPATVGVVIGPQYGPVTAKMVEELVKPAARRYDDLVIAGFSFDGAAQAVIGENPHPKLRIHIAHIRPDVNPGMDGLLKETPGSQLFTVFGQPRTKIDGPDKNGEYVVEMEGVDIYNPVENSITATGASKVAAWFVDGDYDDRTFCITQAFFPDRGAWEKLSKALDGVIDPERFEAFSGTRSLPFGLGKYKRVAVKVIDPRGNEVMSVHQL